MNISKSFIIFVVDFLNLQNYSIHKPSNYLTLKKTKMDALNFIQKKYLITFFLKGYFLFGGWRYPTPKKLKTFPGPIRSFAEMENHIG